VVAAGTSSSAYSFCAVSIRCGTGRAGERAWQPATGESGEGRREAADTPRAPVGPAFLRSSAGRSSILAA
jgi:hypothetical protein